MADHQFLVIVFSLSFSLLTVYVSCSRSLLLFLVCYFFCRTCDCHNDKTTSWSETVPHYVKPNVIEQRWDNCSTTRGVDDRNLPIPPYGNFLHTKPHWSGWQDRCISVDTEVCMWHRKWVSMLVPNVLWVSSTKNKLFL